MKNEVRSILIYSSEESEVQKELLPFDINPQEFIEELTLDPRLKDNELVYVRNQLLEAGANPDNVNQSRLYYFEPETIILA